MSTPLVLTSLGIVIFSAFLFERSKRKYISKVYFPSPPSDFLLGHLHALTKDIPWLTLTKLGRDYGDILQLSVANQSIIVLNKADDAHILLEKRGAMYSDRPRSILQGEIGGLEYFTGFIRYGDDFRVLRRFTIQHFNSRDHVKMYPLLQEQTKRLLRSLLEDPLDFDEHLDRTAAGTMVKSTYGLDIKSKDDPFNKLAIDAFSSVFSLGTTGLTAVDLVPILRYMPSWFPGMKLLERAKEARVLIDRMVEEPYQHVKARKNAGVDGLSVVDSLIEDYDKSGVVDERREYLIKIAAGQIYGAGVETSADVLRTFIFEMIHHPEVAKKAQAEIDNVLGKDQLPTLNDRPDLPYVDCIIKEVMRINPPAPLGVPHASIQEDTYKDKIISAGSIVISNIWAMTRDEQYFPDPDTFNPDRFLNMVRQENEAVHHLNTYRPDDPSILIFGFGRRNCPGRFIADASAWLAIANILAAFNIMPTKDIMTGEDILPEFDWVNGGLTAKLKAFEAQIIPRSKGYIELINQD